jgi:hypothetical protein
MWKVIEEPREAFRLIILAEHKNYAFFLYALFGICVAFAGFGYFRIGDRFENVLPLIFWALLLGLPLGVALCPIVSSFHWILSKTFGGKASFRASLGITSYALTPIIISLVLVSPIELMTFGIYLFTFNPHPISIKPTSYIVLIGLDISMILWTYILSIFGTKVGIQVSLWKSVLIVSILYGLVFSGFLFGGKCALDFFK